MLSLGSVESFWSEKEKISASYLTEGEKKRIKGEQNVPTRILQAVTGSSVLISAAPLVAKGALPHQTVYHGTSLDSANKIFNKAVVAESGLPMRGLLTRFAGTAGRINEYMLAEVVGRSVDKYGLRLTDDEMIKLVMDTKAQIGATSYLHSLGLEGKSASAAVGAVRDAGRHGSRASFGIGKVDPDALLASIQVEDGVIKGVNYNATEITKSSASRYLRGKGITGEPLEDVLKFLDNELKWSGKRVYFGWHPSTVAIWGKKGFKESDWFMERLKKKGGMGPLKVLLESFFDIITFGARQSAEEIRDVIKWRPSKTTTMTLTEVEKHLADLHASGAKKQIVIGTKVPSGSIRWMTDFPGLSTFMAINPGAKATIKHFLPNYDPARDLSTHFDVPSKLFRSVDIVDPKTGVFERIMIKGGGNPPFDAARYMKGVMAVAPYALVGALAADVTQAAVRGEKTYVTKLVKGELELRPSKKNPKVKRWQKRGLQKAASPASREAVKVLKYILPIAATGAALGTAYGRVVEKAMPTEKMKDMNPAQQTAYIAAKQTALSIPTSVASGIGSAVGSGRMLSGDLAGGLRTTLGSSLGSTAIGLPPMTAEQIRRGVPPESQTILNIPLAGKKGERLLEKYPELASAIPLAAFVGAGPTAAYMGRKYYPGHYLALKKVLTSLSR